MDEEPKYHVIYDEGRSEDFLTVDEAVRQASLDDRCGRIPISIACVERGSGRIVYTGRMLQKAIAKWRDAHPGD